MDEEKLQKIEDICHEIIKMTRNTILVNMRFMDAATFRLTPKVTEEYPLATEGKHLYYNPKYLMKLYAKDRKETNRAYLHMLFHCIFRHFIVGDINYDLWDLACDIAVESVINDLGYEPFATPIVSQQKNIIDDLRKKLKSFNAERIYRYYLDQDIKPEKIMSLREIFQIDDHTIWYIPESGSNGTENGNGNGDNDNQNKQQGKGKNGDDLVVTLEELKELEQLWKEISERVAIDMETFSKLQGLASGNIILQLTELNRERYDYTEFLKKFAVMNEAVRVNDDEFDYVYYTYGLQLYEKMPLVEPLEYKDIKQIKEFVIAIDTSGSVLGDLVKNFVQKTYNILKSSESFSNKVNVHIIQCDTEIQEDAKLTCQEDFDNYLNNLQLKGFGGTDFRPVFDYVDELIKRKEFSNLKGLIYFTDGYGIFPSRKPPYETAFVFMRDEYDNPEVPAWAIKLVLEEEDIIN